MRILGSRASRPNLWLLRLPEEVAEPSPVPFNAAVALDRGFARDGWLVLMTDLDVRGIPVPIEGKAFRLGRWWDCVPAPNPRDPRGDAGGQAAGRRVEHVRFVLAGRAPAGRGHRRGRLRGAAVARGRPAPGAA